MSDEVHWSDEFLSIVTVLSEDAKKCIGELDLTEETEIEAKAFWRRMLARATFALVTDVAYRFLVMGHAGYSARVEKISADEFEKYYDLRDDEEKQSAGRATFPEALEFGFRAFAKGFDSDYVVPTSGVEWEAVEQLEELRERMELPDSLAAMTLTEEDVQIILRVMEWLLDNMDKLMDSCPLDAVLRAHKNDPSTS